jgi:hypothetical protein
MSGSCLPERVAASVLVLLYQQLRQYLNFCTSIEQQDRDVGGVSASARSCVSGCTVVPGSAPVIVLLYSRQPEELERSDALLHAAFHVGCEAHKVAGASIRAVSGVGAVLQKRLAQRVRDAVDRLDEVGEDNTLAGALDARRAAACCGAALQSLRGAQMPDATRDHGAPPLLRTAKCVSICTFALVNALVFLPH